MRLPTAVASILVIGLVAAACGGDDATPEPTEEPTPAPVATEAAEEPTEAPAEEPTEAPAEEPTEAPVETEFLTKAQVDSESDPEATYGLTSGRYRMQWNLTDCEQADFLVKQVGGEFEYPKPTTATFASATINDLPEGMYNIQQLDDTCAVWEVRIDRMSA